MQWEFVRADRDTGRYSIKSVRFLKFVGCSRSGHRDGELVQSSDKQMLWKVEGAPGPEKLYRYVWSSFLVTDGDVDTCLPEYAI